MNSAIAPIQAALAALKDTEERLLDLALDPPENRVAAAIRVELLRRRNAQEAALVAALVAYTPAGHPELQVSLQGAVHLVLHDRAALDEQLARLNGSPPRPPGRDIPW